MKDAVKFLAGLMSLAMLVIQARRKAKDKHEKEAITKAIRGGDLDELRRLIFG
jgi:hypothetical protein